MAALLATVEQAAGAVSTCTSQSFAPNNYAQGYSKSTNAFGIESYIPVNSPDVPLMNELLDLHIVTVPSGTNFGLEVGWGIGEEVGDGGVEYGYSTSPYVFATNNDVYDFLAAIGPTIPNGSDYYYAIWWNGSSTTSFRVNTYAGSPTIVYSGGWGGTRNSAYTVAGSEFDPGNYKLKGLTAGSSTISPTLYLNSSNNWVANGFANVCADTGLTVSDNGDSLSVGGTLN